MVWLNVALKATLGWNIFETAPCFSESMRGLADAGHLFFVKEGVFPQNSSELNEKVQQRHESSVKVMPPIKTSGKNKRGERGSTDDEIADPKRVNMAAARLRTCRNSGAGRRPTRPLGYPCNAETSSEINEQAL